MVNTENNFKRLEEMVLVMYNISPEFGTTEQLSMALEAIIEEDEYLIKLNTKKRTINWDDLITL